MNRAENSGVARSAALSGYHEEVRGSPGAYASFDNEEERNQTYKRYVPFDLPNNPTEIDRYSDLSSSNSPPYVIYTWGGGSWNLGDGTQIPALRYDNHWSQDKNVRVGFDHCALLTVNHCLLNPHRLLPHQRSVIVKGPTKAVQRPGAVVRLTASVLRGTIQPYRQVFQYRDGRNCEGYCFESSWSWRQVTGVPVILTDADTSAPTFTMPGTDTPLVFQVTVPVINDRKQRVYSGRVTVNPPLLRRTILMATA